jgi:glycine/D-amino acid oxidase-like deaminating enzyme
MGMGGMPEPRADLASPMAGRAGDRTRAPAGSVTPPTVAVVRPGAAARRPTRDVAVIGGGIIGLATCAAAVERGLDAVCLDAGGFPGEQSRGEGRIFRIAHDRSELCEHALRAAELWAAWERAAGEALLDRVGLAVLGETARERHRAMVDAGADVELADLRGLRDRLPQLGADESTPALWDPLGASIRTGALTGWLLRALGERARPGARVTGASRSSSRWSIAVGEERVRARAIVVCTGTRAPEVAAMFGVEVPGEFTVRRTLRLTFAGRRLAEAPCLIDRRTPVGGSYSLPTRRGYSVGMTGASVEPAAGEASEAELDERSGEACRRYVRTRLVGLDCGALRERVSCEYPVSSLLAGEGWRVLGDDDVRVLVAANAYKFAPLLGAELVLSLGAAARRSRGGPGLDSGWLTGHPG